MTEESKKRKASDPVPLPKLSQSAGLPGPIPRIAQKANLPGPIPDVAKSAPIDVFLKEKIQKGKPK